MVVAKHNAHHAHPNDLETDPDVAWARSSGTPTRPGPDRNGVLADAHQAALFFPMLTLEAVNLRVSSVQAIVRPGLRFRKTEAVLLLGHFALYLALLVTTMTWLQGLVFLVVHQALFGVYLGARSRRRTRGCRP